MLLSTTAMIIILMCAALIAGSIALIVGVRSPPERAPSPLTVLKYIGGALLGLTFLPWLLIGLSFAVAFAVLTAPITLPMVALWGTKTGEVEPEDTKFFRPAPQYV